MIISGIRTCRAFQSWPSWDLVYEWEDVLSKEMNVPLHDRNQKLEKYADKFLKITNMDVNFPFLGVNGYELFWEMTAKTSKSINNHSGLIPCIIDFHLDKNQLNKFHSAYKRNPMLLISSREAFEFLKENNFSKTIYHFPLSISDKYKLSIDDPLEKEYDLVLMGRLNPVLESFLKTYVKEYPDFVYVYRKEVVNNKFIYCTSDGRTIGDISTREDYINLMKKSRIGFYSTPGIDGGEERTKGFNQVTPRFLELLVCGCHILARYKNNPDTDFYELNKFCPSIETYEAFEERMNWARKNTVNKEQYINYLENHYTSDRVKLFQSFT
ncbi:MAG: glycosyltransferase family 1 protein [Candidatus Azobacteroides sp.]|nr:glycosyltransferase family 1 protein [Candidatus Azobacteroides sp.]